MKEVKGRHVTMQIIAWLTQMQPNISMEAMR